MSRDAQAQRQSGLMTHDETLKERMVGVKAMHEKELLAAKGAIERQLAEVRGMSEAKVASIQASAARDVAAMKGSGAQGARRGRAGRAERDTDWTKTSAREMIAAKEKWDEEHKGEEWNNPYAPSASDAEDYLGERGAYGAYDWTSYSDVYRAATDILEKNDREGHKYDGEGLYAMIAALPSDMAQSVAETLKAEGRLG